MDGLAVSDGFFAILPESFKSSKVELKVLWYFMTPRVNSRKCEQSRINS